MAIVTSQQLENASLDCETVELAVNGADDVDVTSRLGAVYPTLAKAQRLIVEMGLLGATPVALASTLTGGYGTDGQFVVVHDDPETDNNVIWEKQAGVWAKSKYNQLPAAKAYADAAVANPNILFDSFNEYVVSDRMFGSWDWHRGSVPANTNATTNIPLLTPKLSSTGGLLDKQWDFAKLGLKAGDVVTVSVLCYFGAVNGRVSAYFRQTDDTNLATQAVTTASTGLQVIKVQITVPAGAIAKFLIRVDYTSVVVETIEVGAYSAAIGTHRAAFIGAPMPKDYLSELTRTATNLLFDPFNEMVTAGKLDNFQSTQNAVFTDLLPASVNSPFKKPTLKGTGAGEVRRFLDVKKMGLINQTLVIVRVAAHYTTSDGSVGIYLRRSDNSVISSLTFTPVVGYKEYMMSKVSIPADAHHVLILLSGSADKELLASAIGVNKIPDFVYGAIYPSQLMETNKLPINHVPDPFFRAYAQGVTSVDGIPTFQEAQGLWSIVDYPTSPFSSKKALQLGAQETAMNKNIPWQRLGVKVGDTVYCRFGIVIPDGGTFKVSAYARQSNNTAIGSLATTSATVAAATYTEILHTVVVTQEMMDDAAVLQLRMNTANTIFASGWYCLGMAIYINQPNNVIRDTNYVEDQLRVGISQQTTSVEVEKYTRGEYYLRETRQRLRKRILSESTQFSVASIGDSWTHSRDRWSGTTAQSLMTNFGDAGGGWLGFGFHPTVTTLVNGNVRSTYSYSRTGTWTSTYGTSPSPDVCHITSSTAADKITLATPASPNISSCTLFYVDTADGVIRYRWNGGSWTSTNVQGTVGNLGTVALTGFAAGANTLEIEVVSGTCSLCGVNYKSTSDGVVWHKLGATGSSALQWSTVNAAQWQAGLTALAPNLVTILHGTNDQTSQSVASFTASMTTLIDRIKAALPLCDILVIMPCENDRGLSPTMAEYAEAIYDLCVTKKVAYLDLQYVFGETFAEYSNSSPRNWFNADGIHPDPLTGGRAISDAVMRFLLD